MYLYICKQAHLYKYTHTKKSTWYQSNADISTLNSSPALPSPHCFSSMIFSFACQYLQYYNSDSGKGLWEINQINLSCYTSCYTSCGTTWSHRPPHVLKKASKQCKNNSANLLQASLWAWGGRVRDKGPHKSSLEEQRGVVKEKGVEGWAQSTSISIPM